MPWPVDALQRVAEYFIGSMNLHHPEETEEQVAADAKSRESGESEKSLEEVQEIILSDLENELVQVVMHFNRSVVAASEK